LRSSLFFPPTKNASVSRKGQADMPWPRVAVTVLCRSGRAMLSGSKSSPKRSTRTHRGTGGEDESPRACVQISDQHTLQRVCKDQRLPSRRRKKDAGERAKEGSRPPYERGVQALRAWSWKRASPLFRPGRPATWTELEGGTRRPASAMQLLSPAPALRHPATLGGGSAIRQTTRYLFSLFRLVL